MELTNFLAVCLVIAAALVLHHQRALKKAKDIVAECFAKVEEIEKSNGWLQRRIADVRSENAQLVQQVKALQAENQGLKMSINGSFGKPATLPESPAPISHAQSFGRAMRPVPSAPLPASVQSNVVYSSGGGGSNVDVVTPAAVAMAFSSIVSEPACDTSSSSYDSGSGCSSSDSGSGGW